MSSRDRFGGPGPDPGRGIGNSPDPGRVPRAVRYRVHLGPALMVGALLVGALLVGGRIEAQSAPVILRDLAYYSGPDFVAGRHTLDLFIPAERPFPIVHFVHGGGWTAGDKQEVPGVRYENVARSLAAEGYAVSLINYRLSDGSAESVMHPEHARDVAQALAYANSLLIARGTRASSHFIMGHDAGAHLAALVASNPRFLAEHGLRTEDIRGVIGLSGIYAVPPLSAEWAEVFGLDPEVRLDASPMWFVEQAAAEFLLLHASDDLPGRADEAKAYAGALVGAGRFASAGSVAGRDHLGIIRRFGDLRDPALQRVTNFVRSVMPAPATRSPEPTRVLSPTSGPTTAPSDTATPTATSSSHMPPGQRPRGPGGAERLHLVTLRAGGVGWHAVLPDVVPEVPLGLIVFVPDNAPLGEKAFGPDMRLEVYDRWLDHLARGGFAVIVPNQAIDGSGLGADDVRAAMADAISTLSRDFAIDDDRVIWAGHGVGATTATVLAAEWFERRLPPPRALFVVDPRRHGELLPWLGPPFLPNDVPVVFVALADAPRADPFIEPALWRATGRVSGRRKTRLELMTDRYGQPWLVADESAPFTAAPGRTDALDWYGNWRALDALAACATTSVWCEAIFGEVAEVQDMGQWSDGRPVEPARVSDGPSAAPWIRIALPSLGN